MKDPNNGLKQVITEFPNAVMLFEAYLQSGALPYEHSPQRKAHRNGTRSRTLKIRVGELTLDKPQFREFPFEVKIRYLLVGATYSKVRCGAQEQGSAGCSGGPRGWYQRDPWHQHSGIGGLRLLDDAIQRPQG